MPGESRDREPDRCIVVGASMGGLRAAEAVRKAGFAEQILVIGDEPHMPYNRPPLSKEALLPAGSPAQAATSTARSLAFRIARAAQDIDWRLDATVVRADLAARTVTLVDGETLSYTGLVIATGLSPRRLPLPGPRLGRHAIRTVDDVSALRAALLSGTRLVVVGAGFIGCEVAAVARGAGLEVDVVAPEGVPIERPLGAALGKALQRRHESHGVRFHLGRLPVRFGGVDRVTSVVLDDGTELAADVVVEAIGCVPNTQWLDGTGLDLTDGVLCDNLLRVEGRPDVVACGDLARFPNPLFDRTPRRVEHWTMVNDTAKRAGSSLGRHLVGAAPDPSRFAPIPSFWSDQYDLRLQSFGAVGLGAGDVRVLEGDLDAEVAVGYHREGHLTGVVLIGLADRYQHYRALFAD